MAASGPVSSPGICARYPYNILEPFECFEPVVAWCSQKFPVAAITSTSTVVPHTTATTTVYTTDVIPTQVTVIATQQVTVTVDVTAPPAANKRALPTHDAKSSAALLAKFAALTQKAYGLQDVLSTACSCIETPRTVHTTVTAKPVTIPATKVVTTFSTSTNTQVLTADVETLVTVTVPAPLPTTNIVQNPSFELASDGGSDADSNADDWEDFQDTPPGGGRINVGSQAHTGSNVVEMVWITRSDGGILIWQADQGLSMITDDSSTHGTYYVSVWVNVQSISAGGTCTLEPETAAGAFLSWTITSEMTGWQQFSGDHLSHLKAIDFPHNQ